MSLLSPYKGYQAKVDYSPEDALLVGEVIGVADSLNFHAESAGEIEEMFHRCIDSYLEFCVEVGKTPEKCYKGSFNVRVTPELHRQAELVAADQQISLNQLVSRALEHELSGYSGAQCTIVLPSLPKAVQRFEDETEPVDAAIDRRLDKKELATWRE